MTQGQQKQLEAKTALLLSIYTVLSTSTTDQVLFLFYDNLGVPIFRTFVVILVDAACQVRLFLPQIAHQYACKGNREG